MPPPAYTIDAGETSTLPLISAAGVEGNPDAISPGELRRFGPGVPISPGTVGDEAAAVWRGTLPLAEKPDRVSRKRRKHRKHRRRRRVLGGWLLPAAVFLAVLGFLAWQRYAEPIAMTGVTVHTDPGGPACNGTAIITGILQTNGRPGTVSYRWKRSDGTVSEALRQQVTSGTRQTHVVLRWTFNGHGTLHATTTLEVLSPSTRTASTSFTYDCR